MPSNYTEPLTFPLYGDCGDCDQLVYRNMSVKDGHYTLYPWAHFGTRVLHDHEVTTINPRSRSRVYREIKP